MACCGRRALIGDNDRHQGLILGEGKLDGKFIYSWLPHLKCLRLYVWVCRCWCVAA